MGPRQCHAAVIQQIEGVQRAEDECVDERSTLSARLELAAGEYLSRLQQHDQTHRPSCWPPAFVQWVLGSPLHLSLSICLPQASILFPGQFLHGRLCEKIELTRKHLLVKRGFHLRTKTSLNAAGFRCLLRFGLMILVEIWLLPFWTTIVGVLHSADVTDWDASLLSLQLQLADLFD